MMHADLGPQRPTAETSRVYVLLVNWNGWAHTIECLESLFRQNYRPFVAVVCDNGSQDGSWEKMLAWARGELPFPGPQNPVLAHLFRRPLAKPIPCVAYDRPTAEAGGRETDPAVPLVFIQTGANLGFGGGNNVGLRYALARGDASHVWLLNNDTVVAPEALERVVARSAAEPQVGAVGSLLLDYHRPDTISSLCGKRLRPWLGVVHSPFPGRPLAEAPSTPPPVDYLEGAACLVPLTVLRRVGLFDPDYVHFWEDVDFCQRILAMGYRLACEPSSRVYHKEKTSMGGHSPRSEYYEFFSGLVYYRKRYPLPWVLIVTLAKLTLKVLNRVRRRQWDRLPCLVQACRDGLRHPLKTR